MILWEGCCPIHDQLTRQEIEDLKELHPEALIVVHPEVPPEVADIADAVRSTAGILKYVQNSPDQEFIIGTEEGFLHTLQKHCPDKTFYLGRREFICPDMKLINLQSLADSMEKMQYQVEVPEPIRSKARIALDRMLAVAP